MHIGLDFDNTLVSYDALFHRVALDQGLIPADLPATKVAVRDHLRRAGREPAWTEMQGTVYGARMEEAQPFPGALDFLRWAAGRGIDLCIVSHKTRHPFIGPQHDLHAAARGWVARHLSALLPPGKIFFELTKEAKLARIAVCACDSYIDDLPEILLAPGFPPGVERVLFDPEAHHGAQDALLRMHSWSQIREHFEAICPPHR